MLLCSYSLFSYIVYVSFFFFFFFQAEDGIRDVAVTGVQTCALPILRRARGVAHLEQQRHGERGAGGAVQVYALREPRESVRHDRAGRRWRRGDGRGDEIDPGGGPERRSVRHRHREPIGPRRIAREYAEGRDAAPVGDRDGILRGAARDGARAPEQQLEAGLGVGAAVQLHRDVGRRTGSRRDLLAHDHPQWRHQRTRGTRCGGGLGRLGGGGRRGGGEGGGGGGGGGGPR